ncbi:MAG: hypothetical protein LBS16_03490 [Prevotellaceae bacterium]|jgi:hypothetical protein|nr:hypothetical protein [Prevotellaceae bacterium]
MKKYVISVLISLLALNSFAQNVQSGTQQRTNTTRPALTSSGSSVTAGTDSGIEVMPILDQNYTGVAFTPKVIVKDGNRTLVENVDYALSYTNNVNVGQAIITISGKGNYSDTKVVNFNIVPKTLNSVQLVPITEQTYCGTPIIPDVLIKDGSKTLVKDVDYAITCVNNVNVGIANATITGKGNYKDSKTTTFRIVPKSMGGGAVRKPASAAASQTTR